MLPSRAAHAVAILKRNGVERAWCSATYLIEKSLVSRATSRARNAAAAPPSIASTNGRSTARPTASGWRSARAPITHSKAAEHSATRMPAKPTNAVMRARMVLRSARRRASAEHPPAEQGAGAHERQEHEQDHG